MDKESVASRCSVPGCARVAVARGWCPTHWMRWRTHGTTDDPEYKARGKVCSEAGCADPVLARMLCRRHYKDWQRQRAMTAPRPILKNQRSRFWERVDKVAEGGCWVWQGRRTPDGYGQFDLGQQAFGAHRFAWELTHGPVPANTTLHHRCFNTLCVRPHSDHVIPSGPEHFGWHRTSPRALPPRQPRPRNTHCRRGHPYEGNCYVSADGKRHCLTCAADRSREWRERNIPKWAKPSTVERFWKFVDRRGPDECWPWIGANGGQDVPYGIFTVKSIHVGAHRFAYELEKGSIPPGLFLDHLCRHPSCVNPAHLEPVTHQENTRRAAALKTSCPQGHPYTQENTYLTPEGWRQCKTCRSERQREARSKLLPRANGLKTHCPYGHLYDAENTYIAPTGHRQCRACKVRRELEYKARQAATVSR